MNDVALKRMAIALPMDEIAAFCRRWGISEFALFGSVLREDFGPESDVDVLLTFRPDADPAPDRERMRRELEALFRRPVDVTYRRVIEGDRNYIIRRAILESAQVVYAA
ncbi:MAG: nucleotidyltransferase family protein [Anaerolineae bacterium]|jgi:predicted nucleotidyltransferase